MKRTWLMVISAVLLLAVVGLAGCGAGGATLSGEAGNLKVSLNTQQEGIWVSGTGKVSAVPDIATLQLGIEAQEASVAEAQAQAAEAMDRVMKALADSGVDQKDIQTQYFNIRRVTRWNDVTNKEEVIGYRVSNMVTAKLRDMGRIGSVIDTVAVAGGDLTRVNNIGFSVEDPTPYQNDAREQAMVEAKAKAGQMAELAGMKLGKPTYVTENVYVPTPIYRQDFFMEKAAGAPAVETPISPGEMEISVTVQVAYAMLD